MGELVVEDVPWSEYEKDALATLIDEQDGIIAGWQARRYLSEKAIRHRVACGRWRRVHRGVYVAYGGPLTLRQRQWVAVLAPGQPTRDGAGALLGGVSALQVHGLRSITSAAIDVVLTNNRKATPPAGVVVHRVRLAEEDRHPCSNPPTTTIGRAVVDAAAWARSDREARLVIAASFQQRLVTAPEIFQALGRMPSTNRRSLVIATTRDAAGGSHSLGELDLVEICRSFALPLPSRQVRFRDASGRMRYLDAVFDQWRVAIEVDGAHHDETVQRWDDIDRDLDLFLATFRVLRLTVHEVRQERAHAAAKLRAVLRAAGWRPTLAWLPPLEGR